MLKSVKIPLVISIMIADCYQCMTAAREYARSITTDPNTPNSVKQDFLHIAASLTTPIERVDRRIPQQKKQEFDEHIKNDDPMRIENIKAMYYRMPIEKKIALEDFCEQLLKGNIQFEQG